MPLFLLRLFLLHLSSFRSISLHLHLVGISSWLSSTWGERRSSNIPRSICTLRFLFLLLSRIYQLSSVFILSNNLSSHYTYIQRHINIYSTLSFDCSLFCLFSPNGKPQYGNKNQYYCFAVHREHSVVFDYLRWSVWYTCTLIFFFS